MPWISHGIQLVAERIYQRLDILHVLALRAHLIPQIGELLANTLQFPSFFRHSRLLPILDRRRSKWRRRLRPHITVEHFRGILRLARRIIRNRHALPRRDLGHGALELGNDAVEFRGGRGVEVLSRLGLALDHGGENVFAASVDQGGEAGKGVEGVEEGGLCDERRWADWLSEEFGVCYDGGTVGAVEK